MLKFDLQSANPYKNENEHLYILLLYYTIVQVILHQQNTGRIRYYSEVLDN